MPNASSGGSPGPAVAGTQADFPAGCAGVYAAGDSRETGGFRARGWGEGGERGGGREGTGPPTILMHFSLPRGRGEGEVRREGGCPRGLNGGQTEKKTRGTH